MPYLRIKSLRSLKNTEGFKYTIPNGNFTFDEVALFTGKTNTHELIGTVRDDYRRGVDGIGVTDDWYK